MPSGHPLFNPSTGPDVAYQPKTTDEVASTTAGSVVPHVNINNLTLAPNAATESTLAALKAAVLAQLELAATLWIDATGAYFLRRDELNATGPVIVWTDAAGTAATPTAPLKPAATNENRITIEALYDATAGGTGYSIGDILGRVMILDVTGASPVVVVSAWLNLTAGTVLSAAPTGGTYAEQTKGVSLVSGTVVTANAGSNLNTSALALESGGVLAAILAKVTAALTVNPRMIVAAATANLTRPNNTTPYTANDSVADLTGSAIVFNLSDLNDAPVSIERLRIATSDTGPAAAGATFEAWVYSTAPAPAADNAGFTAPLTGLIGRMNGVFVSAPGSGSFAVLTPSEGGRLITKPVAGNVTLFLIFKTASNFTSSAGSTVFAPVFEGFQGRA